MLSFQGNESSLEYFSGKLDYAYMLLAPGRGKRPRSAFDFKAFPHLPMPMRFNKFERSARDKFAKFTDSGEFPFTVGGFLPVFSSL